MGFGLLAVVTGFYGMNFEKTWPDFGDPNGIRFVLILIGVVSLAILYVVRRLDDYS
jgi:Mg2+ and Co2+ transporter CorA